MYCPKREHLLAKYEIALRSYAAAVEVMKGKHGSEFDKAKIEADQLHFALLMARDELDRHRLEHNGCGYLETTSA